MSKINQAQSSVVACVACLWSGSRCSSSPLHPSALCLWPRAFLNLWHSYMANLEDWVNYSPWESQWINATSLCQPHGTIPRYILHSSSRGGSRNQLQLNTVLSSLMMNPWIGVPPFLGPHTSMSQTLLSDLDKSTFLVKYFVKTWLIKALPLSLWPARVRNQKREVRSKFWSQCRRRKEKRELCAHSTFHLLNSLLPPTINPSLPQHYELVYFKIHLLKINE